MYKVLHYEGESVIIQDSPELHKLKLDELVGRKGVVTQELISPNRREDGCIVQLDGDPYQGELEWYIPLPSVYVPPVIMEYTTTYAVSSK